MRYTPTAADLADADAFLGYETPDATPGDYVAQHPVSAPPPLQVVTSTDRPPLRLIRMITDADPQAPLRIRNTRGLNVAFEHGITLLHIACRLYALHRAHLQERRAAFYDKVVTALVESGADPMAEMRTARGEVETPASICDGFMPPALRARMLAEAAAGRIDVGSGVPSLIDCRAGRKRRVAASPRGPQRLRDAGSAWEILDDGGRAVAAVPYTAVTRIAARMAAYRQRRRMVA